MNLILSAYDIMSKGASCLHETHFCEKTHGDGSRRDIMSKGASCLHETHFCEKTHGDDSRRDIVIIIRKSGGK